MTPAELAAKLRQIAPRRKEGQAPPIGAFNMDGLCLWELNELINQAADMLDTRKSDDGWRTMESAPKDGGPFLAWIDFEGGCPDMHAIVSWNGENETWHYNGAYAYGGCREGFFVKNWRPLPSPPEG